MNNMQKNRSSKSAFCLVPSLRSFAVPALFFMFASVCSAQAVTDFGTFQKGAAAFVALVRIICGLFAVAAIVFAAIRFAGGRHVEGVVAAACTIVCILLAANAQSIVNGFYSTTG